MALTTAPRAQEIQRWSGAFAEEHDPTTVLAQSPEWWGTIWRKADQRPPLAFDPAHETAIGIFLGRRPTGGYGIKISFMGPRNGKFVVEAEESPPPPGSVTIQALTYPWLVLLIETPALLVAIEPRFTAVALPRQAQ